MLAGLLNYLYYPIMIRYLSIEDFAIFGSIMSLLNLSWIILTGLILFINTEISKNIWNNTELKRISKWALIIFSLLWVALTGLFYLFSPLLANYLKITNLYYFYLVWCVLFFSCIWAVSTSIMRGKKLYGLIAFQQVLAPMLKLWIWALLAFLGYKIYAAIFWVLFSGILVSIAFTLYLAIQSGFLKYKVDFPLLLQDFYKQKKEILHYFFTSLFFALLMNIDILLAKNIFDATQAGIYAALSVLGKFLIFLLLSIETVYFSQIMEYPRNNVPKHLIRNPLILITLTVFFALIGNIIFGKFILQLLKPWLEGYSHIYILSLVFYACLAYISFFLKILTAWKIYILNYILAIMIPILLWSVYIFGNQSLFGFIQIFVILWCSITLLFGVIFRYYMKYKH